MAAASGSGQRAWLSIVGIGEAGVEGLCPDAVRAIGGAALVVGGARHLAHAASLIAGRTLAWRRPIEATLPDILAARGDPVAVLASGDPFWFGAGPMLAAAVPAGERVSIPAISSLALAANLLAWPLAETAIVSLCGRPLETLIPALHPGARILVLSADATTPGAVARLLRERGAGGTTLHLMERLGGPHARVRTLAARDRLPDDVDPLNLIGLRVDADVPAIPIAPGLDDGFFESDGQLTRHELRAAAIAALAPHPGELLWDVGAGAGSVAIEWCLRAPSMRAVAFERRDDRCARIGRNARALGVPGIALVGGEAPGSFDGRDEAPDAVFLGGGGRQAAIAAAHGRLRPGGRLVAHSVTLETDAALFEAEAKFGGTLSRFSIERLDTIGGFRAFRPSMTVTQWSTVKP